MTVSPDKIFLKRANKLLRSNHSTSIRFMDEIGKSHINILRVAEDIESDAKAIF